MDRHINSLPKNLSLCWTGAKAYGTISTEVASVVATPLSSVPPSRDSSRTGTPMSIRTMNIAISQPAASELLQDAKKGKSKPSVAKASSSAKLKPGKVARRAEHPDLPAQDTTQTSESGTIAGQAQRMELDAGEMLRDFEPKDAAATPILMDPARIEGQVTEPAQTPAPSEGASGILPRKKKVVKAKKVKKRDANEDDIDAIFAGM